MAGPWEAYGDQGQEGQSGPWQAYGGANAEEAKPANVVPQSSVMSRIKDFVREHLPRPPLQHSIMGQTLEDIKNARRASQDLTESTVDPGINMGRPTPADEPAGTMFRNAMLGSPVPRGLNTIGGAVAPRAVTPAEAFAAQNALKSRTPLPPKAPTAPELITEAQQRGYKPAEQQALQTPLNATPDQLATNWRSHLGTVGEDELSSPKTFGTLKTFEKVDQPSARTLMNLRMALRETGEEGAKALLPQVEAELENHAPGIMNLIQNVGDKNYNAGMIGQRFGEGVERKQMQRAGQVGDRLIDLAKEQLFNKDSKYLTPEAEQALEKFGSRTNYENIMHNVGRVGGALHWSMAGLGSFFHPATMAVPAAGSIARHLYNRSVLQRAGETAQNLVASSPLNQSRQAAYKAALSSHLAGRRSQDEVAAAMGILARPVASSPATVGVMPTPQQLVPY